MSLEIARLRMRNSKLTGDSFDTPEQTVRWLGAMQAQDYGPAKWSIGQRTTNVVDEDIERAVTAGSIIRTHVLRATWHLVAVDDVRALLQLTGPRVHRHNERRYGELELDPRTRASCEALIASAVQGGNHLTRDEIAGVLKVAGIDASGQRLPHILMHCELESVICSGGIKGKKQTYALLDERVPSGDRFNREEALIDLVGRYLRSHGPATVQDIRWWSSLSAADIRGGLNMLGPRVQSESVNGLTFWSMIPDMNHMTEPQPRPAIHLLQAYDELMVGYTESRFFGDPRGPAARAAWRDRRLPGGFVIMDGAVLGHWRRAIDRARVKVAAFLYEKPKPTTERALEAATANLGRFLGRDSTVETTLI